MIDKLTVVALTGGIGCGKSIVSQYFQQKGIPCIDADAMVHALYRDKHPEIMQNILERWGQRVFDANGQLDRKALAEIVFPSNDELVALMNIVLPVLKKQMISQIDEYRRKNTPFIILDVPLLFEQNIDKLADVVIAVWAPYSTVLERVKKYRNWSEAELASRSAKQMSPEKKQTHTFEELPNCPGFVANYTMIKNRYVSTRLSWGDETVRRRFFKSASTTVTPIAVDVNEVSMTTLAEKLSATDFVAWCHDNGVTAIAIK